MRRSRWRCARPATSPTPARPCRCPPDSRVSLACNTETVASLLTELGGSFAQSLGRVSVPSVFVLGAASPLAPAGGERVAALMPDAEVSVIPGAGHLPWHESPGCVAAALSRLDDRLSGRR